MNNGQTLDLTRNGSSSISTGAGGGGPPVALKPSTPSRKPQPVSFSKTHIDSQVLSLARTPGFTPRGCSCHMMNVFSFSLVKPTQQFIADVAQSDEFEVMEMELKQDTEENPPGSIDGSVN